MTSPADAPRQRWPRVTRPRPIVLIGAGGIVNDAHLPAYRALGLPVAGVFDVDADRCAETARRWSLARTYPSLAEAAASEQAVFDVAVPPGEVLGVLEALPEGAPVLIQKPLGRDLAEATAIVELCEARGLLAAVNFQLRYAPSFLALADLVARGELGRLVEWDVSVNCRMPWELWPFLAELPRMEIALHSIHYLDTIRAFLGDPRAVFARTVRHPAATDLASSRTSAILDHGDDVRCCLSVNHHHGHGPRYQRSEMRVEGTAGAAVVVMGVNLDYPQGRPDSLHVALGDAGWTEVPLRGSWFPEAFEGPMSALQRVATGEDERLPTAVADAWSTMALVEACYTSDATGGTPVPRRAGDEVARLDRSAGCGGAAS